MAYIRPAYNSDSVTWVGKPAYSLLTYNSANVSFEDLSYLIIDFPVSGDNVLGYVVLGASTTSTVEAATQLNISVEGQTPSIALGIALTPTQETVVIQGQIPSVITIRTYGSGFFTDPNIQYAIPNSISVSGGTFTQTPKLYGGALVSGGRFKSQPVLTLSAAQTAYVTGSRFNTQPVIRMVSASNAQLEGRGFASVATIIGAAVVVGTGVRSSLTATGVAPERIDVTGSRFNFAINITYEEIATGRVTGRGFFSGLVRSTVTGRGFTQQSIIESLLEVEYSEAFVLNLIPPAEGLYSISRYQHFPFKHLAKIGNEYYGLKDDGLYLLTGDYDIDEVVNGKIVTNDEDLSIYNSKTIAYVYLNGDDDYEVQAVVDHVEQSSFNSGFSGRRVKLARGSKGRYWYFNVSGIKHLQGIEYRPEGLSRKVK